MPQSLWKSIRGGSNSPLVGELRKTHRAVAADLPQIFISAHTIFMIQISSYETLTSHSRDQIYRLWADPITWPSWDTQVKSVTFTGPALVGAKGRLKPISGPASTFRIETADQDTEFTTVSKLPGAKLRFRHLLCTTSAGTLVRVSIELSGPLTALWRRLLGTEMGEAAKGNVSAMLNRVSAP